MRADFDLIVVGAGVLGTFHAYWAARRGWKTLLVERNDWPRDASIRNFGTLVPSAMAPGVWQRRGLESVAIYREIASHCPISFAATGTLYPATTPVEAAVLHEFSELGPKAGYRCELLDNAAARRFAPALNDRAVRCSLHFADDARVEPRSLFPALLRWMSAELGIEYRPNSVVRGIKSDEDVATILLANGGSIRTKQAVVCSGAELRALFPDQLAAASMRTCKLQMCRIAAPSSKTLDTNLASGLTQRRYSAFRMCPSWPRLADEQTAAGVLDWGIHILAVRDADGSIVLGDSHEYAETNESLDERYSSAIEEAIVAEAKKLMDLTSWRVTERWCGIYSLLPDGDIFVDCPQPRVRIVTGIGGKGMTTGPALAREIVDSIAVEL